MPDHPAAVPAARPSAEGAGVRTCEPGDASEIPVSSGGDLGQLQLDALLGRTDLGIAACDASGELTFLSPALQKLMGQPFEPHAEAEQVERYRLYESDASTRLQPEAVPLARARRGEVVTDELICAHSATGRLLYLLCSALPVLGRGGSLEGAVVFVQDVTDEHLALQEQEQARDRLVTTLNHEFRTPLTRLVGCAEILHDLSDDFSPEVARFVTKIRQAAEELTALVEHVTSLADLHSLSPRNGTTRECAARSHT